MRVNFSYLTKVVFSVSQKWDVNLRNDVILILCMQRYFDYFLKSSITKGVSRGVCFCALMKILNEKVGIKRFTQVTIK